MPSQKDITNFVEIDQDMFTTGTLTTSAALTFCVIQLVNKPNIQQKLYEEVSGYLSDN